MKLLISLGRDSFSNVEVPFKGTADEAILEGKRLVELAFGTARSLSVEEQKTLTDYLHNSLNGGTSNIEVWESFHPIVKQVLKCYRNAQNRKKTVIE